jgi:hypothetical protein
LPINYKLYPSDWQEIRKRILERDGHCCKTCKVENGVSVFRGVYEGNEVFQTVDGNIYHTATGELLEQNFNANIYPSSGNENQRAIKIVLTVAHLNHDIKDNRDENLAALCQLHHLRHDKDQHKKSTRDTRLRKSGLTDLFK